MIILPQFSDNALATEQDAFDLDAYTADHQTLIWFFLGLFLLLWTMHVYVFPHIRFAS